MTPEQRAEETIVAGIQTVQSAQGTPDYEATAIGPLCRYEETETSQEAVAGGECKFYAVDLWTTVHHEFLRSSLLTACHLS